VSDISAAAWDVIRLVKVDDLEQQRALQRLQVALRKGRPEPTQPPGFYTVEVKWADGMKGSIVNVTASNLVELVERMEYWIPRRDVQIDELHVIRRVPSQPG
jgi:hypothetical protein